jgi:hypothetical protein
MNRLSDEARSCIAILVGLVSISLLIWVIMWAINQQTAEAQACEDLGGHMYNRQVGKLHYHKCVTDDNQVILE